MDEIKVFIAFVRGVAHALPEFATEMIEKLGAEPAEWADIYMPLEVIVRYRRGDPIISGGSDVHGHGCNRRGRNDRIASLEARYFHRRNVSWKHNRRPSQWRRIAAVEAWA